MMSYVSSPFLQQLLLLGPWIAWPSMEEHPACCPFQPPDHCDAGLHTGSQGPRFGKGFLYLQKQKNVITQSIETGGEFNFLN